MAYLKPPPFVGRVFNPLAMWLGLGGSVTVAVHGRRSGKLRKIPVLPVEYEDARYLVSTRGESEWVKNLRAAGGEGELTVGGKTDPFQATEVPVGERASIIAAYRTRAGRLVNSYFTRLPDPADHPVFRIKTDAAK